MATSGSEGKELTQVDVDLITENPFQPRKAFHEDEINELAESIKTHGLIQPVILRRSGERYQIVAGERRLRAYKKNGMSKIPAIVQEIDGIEVAEVSLIENVQRRNLNCIEEAEAFNIMKIKFGMTAEEIAKKIGKSRPYVSNMLRLTALTSDVRQALVQEKITMGHGRALLAIEDQSVQTKTLNTVIRDALSVRQTEDLVTKLLSDSGVKKKTKKKSPMIEQMDEEAMDHFMALRDAIKSIKKTGGKVDVIERETDDFFEYVIRVPR